VAAWESMALTLPDEPGGLTLCDLLHAARARGLDCNAQLLPSLEGAELLDHWVGLRPGRWAIGGFEGRAG
jgi:hypothetical protein